MHHPFAMLERLRQRAAKLRLGFGRHHQTGHRQLDGVFFEAVNSGKALRGQELAVNPQMGVAPRARPIGEFGVHPFAVHHQGAEHTDVLPAVLLQPLGRNAVGRLRLHSGTVVDAMLRAQFHIQQAQEMPDLGGRAHGGFPAAARQALLDGDGRRNAIDRVDLGTSRGLDNAARIGIQAFQVAALSFIEQDVEGQG